MKKMQVAAMITAGVIGAGVAGYFMMNQKTKTKVHKVINNALDETNKQIKKIS